MRIYIAYTLQKEYRNNDSIIITMISKDNFLLFTPMLPEVATGAVETRLESYNKERYVRAGREAL